MNLILTSLKRHFIILPCYFLILSYIFRKFQLIIFIFKRFDKPLFQITLINKIVSSLFEKYNQLK